MAERYGDELADALPEVDLVAGFGVPVTLTATRCHSRPVPSFDLLNLPRPPAAGARGPTSRWPRAATGPAGSAPSRRFRGKQRSRSIDDILAEVDALEVQEVVLVAQDLASYGRDHGRRGDIVPLVAGGGRPGGRGPGCSTCIRPSSPTV